MRVKAMRKRSPYKSGSMQGRNGQPHHRSPAVGEPPGRPPNEAPCVDCGWPDTNWQVVSRHRTSEGVVVWTRCVCGALQVWLHRPGAPEAVALGRQSHDYGRRS